MTIGNFYKGNNFWEANPTIRAIAIFDDLYSSDRSKGKKASSDIMWAIAFCLHKESPMYNLPDKWELAARDIIGNNKFKWDSVRGEVDVFRQTQLTQAERSMLAWEEMMLKRDRYLKDQEYYFDHINEEGKMMKGTAEQLDRAFSVTPKMYSDFTKIKKELEEEEIKRGRGNKVKSMTETGEI